MSLINDALKEARQDNGASNSGQKMGMPPSRQPGSGNKGVILALVVMGAVCTLAIGGVFVLFVLFTQSVNSTQSSGDRKSVV